MRRRINLPKPSDGIRHTFTALAEELAKWPGVSTRQIFGVRAIYREGVVFAMLPDKRSLGVADAVAYKVGGKWSNFEVRNEDEIGGAIAVLGKAYEAAK